MQKFKNESIFIPCSKPFVEAWIDEDEFEDA